MRAKSWKHRCPAVGKILMCHFKRTERLMKNIISTIEITAQSVIFAVREKLFFCFALLLR